MKRKSILTILCCAVFASSMAGTFVACNNANDNAFHQTNTQNDQNTDLLTKVLRADSVESLYVKAMSVSSELTWSEVQLQKEYDFNVTLEVPQRTVKVNGVDTDCVSYLVYPNGNGTSKTTVALDQSGLYEIRYALVVNGTPYLKTETFTVKNQTYYVKSAHSTVGYSTNAYSQNEGLNVRLANGDTLTFGQALDLSQYSKDIPLLETYVTPDTVGEWDFSKLYITFTDASDSDVYLKVKVQRSKMNPYFHQTHLQAAGVGQKMTGRLKYQDVDKLCVEDDRGTLSYHSFIGESTKTDWSVDQYQIRLYYDIEENALYNESDIVADFDSEEYFSTLWSGFKSDKVYVSITADEYTGENTANFCITSLFGTDLTQKTFEDTTAPVLNVQTEKEYVAKVGGSYPVSKATAYDNVDGHRKVSVSAWYNYGSANPIRLDIKDGRFETKYAGMYAIVYESTDKIGNLARYVQNVTTGEVPALTISVSHEEKTATLGERFVCPAYTLNADCVDATVEIYAERNGEKYSVVNGEFIPEKAGEWSLVYVATDAVGQTATATYTFTAEKGNKPVFVDAPVLPPVYISGSTYVVPQVYANDYATSEVVKRLATVSVTDANGTKTYNAGDTFVPTVDNNGDMIKLTFTCGAGSLEKEIPAVLVWVYEGRPRLYMERYLFGEEFTTVKNTTDITIEAQSANAGWIFANALVAEGFTTRIDAEPTADYFDGLKFTLRDSIDETSVLEFSILKSGQKSKLCVAGEEIVMPIGFTEDSYSNAFSITYKNGQLSVGETTVEVSAHFASGKVYYGVSFIGAKAGAKYKLLKINETVMCELLSDRSGPKIAIYGELGGCYRINETFIIPSAMAGDVFDPNVNVSVSAVDPNGNYVKDVNGLELKNVPTDKEYEIVLSAYGAYTVTYSASDTFNKTPNPSGLSFSMHVEDREAPTVKMKGKIPTELTVGKVLRIPNFKISDNVTAKEALIVTKCIVLPSGKMIMLVDEENAITATQAGTYEIRIYVTDEAGNGTLIRKYVKVV